MLYFVSCYSASYVFYSKILSLFPESTFGAFGSMNDTYFMNTILFIEYTYRESLFENRISSCKLPSSNHIHTPGTYKFSTFGYNPHDENAIVQDIPMHSYPRRGSSIVSHRLDSITPAHAPIYSYEPIMPAKYNSPSPAPSTTPTTITTVTTAASIAGAAGTITPTLRTFNGAPKKRMPSKWNSLSYCLRFEILRPM